MCGARSCVEHKVTLASGDEKRCDGRSKWLIKPRSVVDLIRYLWLGIESRVAAVWIWYDQGNLDGRLRTKKLR